MTDKQKELVRILLTGEKLTAAQLAGRLDCSVRSVHNYIGEVNSTFPQLIESSQNGYLINVENIDNLLGKMGSHIPQTPAERCNYILYKLVQAPAVLSAGELCDDLFISASTFRSLLGRLRRWASQYDLIVNTAGDEISITGTEKNKRRMLSSILYAESKENFISIETIQNSFPEIDVETIHEIVISALNEYHYFINDYSLVNLLLHVTIAIHRIENCCNVVPSSGAASLIRAHEYEVAKKITDALEAAFGVHFAQGESYDIALMLISRASSMDYQSISVENISLYVGEKCWQLVQKLVMAVRDYYDIDLSQQEFLVRFSLHIKNLLTRSENHSYCQNPLTSDIKGNCPLIYDVAVQLAGIIREQTGLTIDDDEIAFIAFHLGGALETQRALASRISAVLYCPSYYNMDAALYEKLNGRFREELVVTNVVTREQDIKKIQGVELIIATVPLHAPMTIPRVMITPFLTETNCFDISCYIKNIKEDQRRRMFRENLCTMLRPEFFERASKPMTQNELIHHICGKLQKAGYVDAAFEAAVQEREQVSSTAFRHCAIPHTLKMIALRTGMFAYLSEEPLQWGEHTVNLVILLCFNRGERQVFHDIFDPLAMILYDNAVIKNAAACTDYQQFIDYLVSCL